MISCTYAVHHAGVSQVGLRQSQPSCRMTMVHEPLRQPRFILAAPLEQEPGLLANVLLVLVQQLVAHNRAHHLAELGRE
eukprot:15033412-Heterocapsa_arctica.AAC.1